MVLLHQRAEYVGKRFIQRTRLLEIDQPGFGFGYAMRQLMRDHVDSDGKAIEYFAVAVAKHHLLSVPEGVLIRLAIVNGAKQLQPLIVERITLIGLPEKIVGDAKIIPGFSGGDVARI